MENFRVLSREEESRLDVVSLINYYNSLINYYSGNSNNDYTRVVHDLFSNIAGLMRSYPITGDKESDLVIDGSVIFACNHSNVHDYYTVQEVLKKMVNVLVASDSLSFLTEFLFKISGAVLIDRNDKVSSFNGINTLVSDLVKGNNVCVFPESTWNIHPSKLMLPMKVGVIKLAAKSGRPIIPVIFEYVENNRICEKEDDIYEECIIKFGAPIYVSVEDNIKEMLEMLRNEMASLRWSIWESLGLYKREELSDSIYYNHTELKCNTSMFKYAWKEEERYIHGSDNYFYEYCPVNRVIENKKIKILKK